MSEAELKRLLSAALDEQGIGAEALEALASQLLWRVGRISDEAPVTVRVGYAGSAQLFAELPRLRSATDAEIETAVAERSIRVEWVGHR